MNFLKSLLLVLILFIALILVGVGLLVTLVNPNQFKPLIIQQVAQQTGYQLTIDGDLSWSFSPPVSIMANHMILTGPKPQAVKIVDMSDVKIGVQLWPVWEVGKHLQGNLTIANLTFMQLHVSNVNVNIDWRDQHLSLKPLTAELYQGRLQGEVHLFSPATAPTWHWQLALNDLQVAPLLHDLNGPQSKLEISGIGEVVIDAKTSGLAKADILAHLNGDGSFRLRNGVLSGINVEYLVAAANAFLQKQAMPATPAQNQTDFGDLSGSYTIHDGIVTTNNFLIDSSGVATHGKGTLDLNNQAINFNLQLTSKHTRNLAAIPVVVKGTMSSPSAHLDLDALSRELTASELQKVKEKVRKQIQEHIHGKAGQFLQNLLGH